MPQLEVAMSRFGSTAWARSRCTLNSILTALILSACGSTVQWSDTSRTNYPDGGQAVDELAVGPRNDREVLSKERVGSSTRSVAGSDQGRPGEYNQGLRQGADSGERPVGLPSGSSGQGFTSKEIYIGFGAVDDADTYANQVGFNTNFGRQSAFAKAMAKEINAQGGLAGRKLVPVIHQYDTAELVNRPGAAAQAACERWTVDRPVIAVINLPGARELDETLAACLSRKRIPYGNAHERPEQFYSRFGPFVYGPPTATVERAVRAEIGRLKALGYFGGWDFNDARPSSLPLKVGLIRVRETFATEFEDAVRQELGRHGFAVTTTAEISALERAPAELNSIAVRFRSANVTHVIAQSHLVLVTLAFDSQSYYPRLALRSLGVPREAQSLGAKKSLSGALGAGYRPVQDVDNKRDPDLGAAESRCRKVMKNAGLDTSAREAWNFMAQTCDLFMFNVNAIEKGGMSAEGFSHGVRAMRDLESAVTFRATYPNGRPFGASAIRDLKWDGKCDNGGCVRYIGGNRAL